MTTCPTVKLQNKTNKTATGSNTCTVLKLNNWMTSLQSHRGLGSKSKGFEGSQVQI